MIGNEQPNKEEQVTPKGAVEIDEKDLDQAAGGVSSGGDLPTESISLNYSKIEVDRLGQKVDPQDPSIGLLRDGEKSV